MKSCPIIAKQRIALIENFLCIPTPAPVSKICSLFQDFIASKSNDPFPTKQIGVSLNSLLVCLLLWDAWRQRQQVKEYRTSYAEAVCDSTRVNTDHNQKTCRSISHLSMLTYIDGVHRRDAEGAQRKSTLRNLCALRVSAVNRLLFTKLKSMNSPCWPLNDLRIRD